MSWYVSTALYVVCVWWVCVFELKRRYNHGITLAMFSGKLIVSMSFLINYLKMQHCIH